MRSAVLRSCIAACSAARARSTACAWSRALTIRRWSTTEPYGSWAGRRSACPWCAGSSKRWRSPSSCRPRALAARFETLLGAAQAATMIHEDHNYWIDQRVLYQLRRLLLELGRRLAAAGVLAEAGDVFLLTPDELASAVRGSERLTAVT